MASWTHRNHAAHKNMHTCKLTKKGAFLHAAELAGMMMRHSLHDGPAFSSLHWSGAAPRSKNEELSRRSDGASPVLAHQVLCQSLPCTCALCEKHSVELQQPRGHLGPRGSLQSAHVLTVHSCAPMSAPRCHTLAPCMRTRTTRYACEVCMHAHLRHSVHMRGLHACALAPFGAHERSALLLATGQRLLLLAFAFFLCH
jgi:hypothetical protein